MKKSIGVSILSLFITSFCWAAIELPNVIGSNMVLQRDLPVPIIIDHLSRVRGGQGIGYAGFQALMKLMQETQHVWAKISSWYRLSDEGPPYDDMTPLARALIETRAERVVWGTNWPHPILWDHPMPNDAGLFDQFMDWAGDDDTRYQILVTNPESLYGFEV